MATDLGDPARPRLRPRGRGRRPVPRPDPDRHHQLRRRRRTGGAEGRRVRRRAARRGRHRVTLYESEPGRTNARRPLGRRRRTSRRCCVHGHLDVVPAAAEDWQVDPFSGEIQDGFVWGRGAVDMKDFDAMLLSVVRARARGRRLPDREVVLCLTADEEAGGHKGAEVLVEEHPDELADCTEAVGEVGGFSATVRGRRIYLIEAAEKGMAWMKLTARGRAGHGSMINTDNAVTRLAGAVARIGAHQWPVRLTPTMEVLLADRRRHRRHRGHARERRVADRGVRQRRPDARRGHPQHRQPDDARRRLQGQRHPHRGDRARRRPLPARLRGRVLRHPARAARAGHRDRLPLQPAAVGDAVRRRPGRRDDPHRCSPRTRTPSSRRTS